MHSLPFRATHTAAVLIASAGLAVSACSSNSSVSTSTSSPAVAPPTSSSPPPSAGAEPTTGAAAIAAIKTNWAKFFNINTPNAQRVALLQDGAALASVIAAESKITLAQGSAARAKTVTLTGTSMASVVYDILLHGHLALGNQVGVAIYQNGVWKVGLASFCGLLKLLAQVSTLKLPAACPK